MFGSDIGGLSDTIVKQIQYAIDVSGTGAVHDLENALQGVNGEIAKQATAYAAGTVTLEQFEADTAKLVRQQMNLAAQTRLASAAMASGGQITSELVQQLRQAERAVGSRQGGGLAYGLTLLGNTADDLQYGFKSIVNNIPGLVMAMTGNAGLAGASAIVAVALNQLIQRWETLEKFLDPTKVKRYADSISGMTEHVAKLKKELDGSAVAAEALNQAEEKLNARKGDLSAFEAAKNRPSEAQKATAEAFAEWIGKAGGVGPLADSVANAKRADGSYFTADETKDRAKAKADLEAADKAREDGSIIGPDGKKQTTAALQAKVKAAEKKLIDIEAETDKAARERSDAQVGRLVKGDKNAHGAMLDLAMEPGSRKFFTDGQRAALELSEPDYLQGLAESDKKAEKSWKAAKEADEAAKKRGPMGPGRPEELEIIKQETSAAVKRFGPELEDVIDRKTAEMVRAGKADDEIKASLNILIRARLESAKVRGDIAENAAEEMSSEGLKRFDAEVAGRDGPGGREGTAKDVLGKLNKKANDESKRKAAADKARINEVANQSDGAAKGIEADLLGAQIERNQFESLTPQQQRAIALQRGRMFAAQARSLRDRIDKANPRTDAERENHAAAVDQLELLEARSRNPIPSADQVAKNDAELLARRNTRLGVKNKDGKTLTLDENRKVAGQIVADAQRDLTSKLASSMDGTLSRQESMLRLLGQMDAQINNLTNRGARLDAQLNGLIGNRNGRPRTPNQPRMPR